MKAPKIHSLVLLFFLFWLNEPATCQSFATDHGYAKVEGSSSLADYTGTSQGLSGHINLIDSTVSFHLPLATLSTGNTVRDRHMRNTLEVTQYPQASFRGKIVQGFPQRGVSTKTIVKGHFTIHGVEKEIEVRGEVKWQQDQMKVKAGFPIQITEYKMKRPSFLMMSVDDQHMISIDLTLNKQ